MSRNRARRLHRRWLGHVCTILLVVPPLGTAVASGGRDTEAAYALGKAVMHRELACDECPLDHAPRSREEAEHLRELLEAGEVDVVLTGPQRWAVGVYLEERWGL